ncbi:MAG: DUF917 domain-containing protein [Candidatus Binataceae bacterium]
MSFEIRRRDISAFTLGSTVLGCGGGGNSYYGQLVARRLLADDSAVAVIDVDEMDPESFAITPAAVGAPLVCLEKPPSLIALHAGLESVKAALRGRVSAFFAGEIGGLQCIFPLLLAAEAGLPMLDGDGMGRAFPELQMTTFAIYGTTHGLPRALSGDRGLLSAGIPKDDASMRSHSAHEPRGIRFERVVRRVCAAEGGLIYLTSAFDQESLRRTLVRGSISLALRIGRAVESARAARRDPIAAIVEAAEGKRFVTGKIVDVERQFRAGHDWGTVRIEGVDDDRGRGAEIAFKNEYLVLRFGDHVALTVPDLITLIETETGTPVSTDILRPGLRVTVVGLPASPLLRTAAALKSVGPGAFGYDLSYVSLK